MKLLPSSERASGTDRAHPEGTPIHRLPRPTSAPMFRFRKHFRGPTFPAPTWLGPPYAMLTSILPTWPEPT